MKTIITATVTALLMTTATTATADQSCTVKTDTAGNQIKNKKCDLFKGGQGIQGPKGDQGIQGPKGDQGNDGKDGTNGTNGTNGVDGRDGVDGATGATGANGTNGEDGTKGDKGDRGEQGVQGADGNDGVDGENGKDAVAPLGSLSFAAATASFYGDGIGFGLSDSNYGGLEGSIVLGFDLDYNWRVVAGVTTDFKDKVAASAGLGYSF